jgi:hypothetical protein
MLFDAIVQVAGQPMAFLQRGEPLGTPRQPSIALDQLAQLRRISRQLPSHGFDLPSQLPDIIRRRVRHPTAEVATRRGALASVNRRNRRVNPVALNKPKTIPRGSRHKSTNSVVVSYGILSRLNDQLLVSSAG